MSTRLRRAWPARYPQSLRGYLAPGRSGHVVELPGLGSEEERGDLVTGEQHRARGRVVAVSDGHLAIGSGGHLDTVALGDEAGLAPTEAFGQHGTRQFPGYLPFASRTVARDACASSANSARPSKASS